MYTLLANTFSLLTALVASFKSFKDQVLQRFTTVDGEVGGVQNSVNSLQTTTTAGISAIRGDLKAEHDLIVRAADDVSAGIQKRLDDIEAEQVAQRKILETILSEVTPKPAVSLRFVLGTPIPK